MMTNHSDCHYSHRVIRAPMWAMIRGRKFTARGVSASCFEGSNDGTKVWARLGCEGESHGRLSVTVNEKSAARYALLTESPTISRMGQLCSGHRSRPGKPPQRIAN